MTIDIPHLPPAAGPLEPGDTGGGASGMDETGEDGPHRGRSPYPARQRLSEFLAAIAADTSRSDITVADLLDLMRDRARAALIFLMAFPNVLPAPPGLSAILGLPLLYLTAQMMLGRMPRLPKAIGAKGVPRSTFASAVARVAPHLARAERMLRPRWSWIVSPRAERALGAFAFVLALVVTLPIPFGNMLPALAICLLALGVLERDGLWAGLGVVVGLGAIALSATVAYAMTRGALALLLAALS